MRSLAGSLYHLIQDDARPRANTVSAMLDSSLAHVTAAEGEPDGETDERGWGHFF